MAFMDLTKKELIEAAEYFGADYAASDSKQDIVDAIEEAGGTWELYQESLPAEEEPEPVVEAEEQPEPADEEEPLDEEEPEDVVLVRFIGRNRSYQTGKWTFSQTSPFALMTKPEYDALDRFKFREATKSEAEEFYSN